MKTTLMTTLAAGLLASTACSSNSRSAPAGTADAAVDAVAPTDASSGTGGAPACAMPASANTMDDAGVGCAPLSLGDSVVCIYGSCSYLCAAAQYALNCVADAGTVQSIPAPAPSLNCQTAGYDQPPASQEYCCPCQ
jgi:hypothetical protein